MSAQTTRFLVCFCTNFISFKLAATVNPVRLFSRTPPLTSPPLPSPSPSPMLTAVCASPMLFLETAVRVLPACSGAFHPIYMCILVAVLQRITSYCVHRCHTHTRTTQHRYTHAHGLRHAQPVCTYTHTWWGSTGQWPPLPACCIQLCFIQCCSHTRPHPRRVKCMMCPNVVAGLTHQNTQQGVC